MAGSVSGVVQLALLCQWTPVAPVILNTRAEQRLLTSHVPILIGKDSSWCELLGSLSL